MHVNSFVFFICALNVVCWSAIWLRNHLAKRRRRAWQAAWDDLVRRYSHLDRELDRVWHRR